jgi:ABC transporter transmembrane region
MTTLTLDRSCAAVDGEAPKVVGRFAGPSHRGERRGLHHLRAVFRAHWGPILLTYALFSLENLLWISQPYVLGVAIDKLLGASYRGLLLFAAVQSGHLLIGVLRRIYDTRMFSRIHAELVTRIVLEHRDRDVEVTRIAARSALSREFIEFFERYVPIALQTIFLIFGGLVILASYDRILMLSCIALIVPAILLNASYGRRTLALSGALHDTLEREIEVIGRAAPSDVRIHYGLVARWRIKLSDSEAINVGVVEVLALALMVASLVRSCGAVAASPGEILALLRYVLMFVSGLDGISLLVQQTSRLCDIGRRCCISREGAGAP